MQWGQPPKIKIYEALGALSDGRAHLRSPISARVFSSSGGKFYTVTYDPARQAIMANDNGSYWQGYLGYPAIAFLMKIGKISYNKKISQALKGIAWKDLNIRFENDFEKTLAWADEWLAKKRISREMMESEVDRILRHIEALELSRLGKKIKPPVGH